MSAIGSRGIAMARDRAMAKGNWQRSAGNNAPQVAFSGIIIATPIENGPVAPVPVTQPLPLVPNPTFKSEFQIKCKLSQFTKVTDKGYDQQHPGYKSPKFTVNGLLWSFEIRPTLDRINEKRKHYREAEWMKCILYAKDPTVGRHYGNHAVWVTASSSYYRNNDNPHSDRQIKQSLLPGHRCTFELEYYGGNNCKQEVTSWWEEEILFPTGPKSSDLDGYVCVTVTELDDLDWVENGKYFKMQQELLTQMKDEAKVVDLFLKLSDTDGGSGSETSGGNPPLDFRIVSKSGSVTGFHKAVLKVRGGEHLKACINSGMTESVTSQLKWATYDHDLIQGFKAYLYKGTLPNLKSMAEEYFKLGDYCQLDQIKEMAELELCKKVHFDKKFIEGAYVLARNYKTKYLKDEIKKLWKSNPKMLERIIDDNFDALVDLKISIN